MHPFEIAEHGLPERKAICLQTSKVFLAEKRIINSTIKRKPLITFKKGRKFIKKIKKRNRKTIKKLRKLLFPVTFNPANALT